MSSLPDNAPSPRLCIIVKWPDFEGYGFNLHAEKSKPGQYIGKVDEKSPAEAAGLLEGDRIIEVNGANIANENHKQVVQRIKAVPIETRLLVVDPQTDKYYKSKNIVVRGTQENVIVCSSAREENAMSNPEEQPISVPTVSNGHHEDADNRSVSSAASSSAASEASTQPQHGAARAEAQDATEEEATSREPVEEERRSPSPPPSDDAPKPSGGDISDAEGDGDSLEGSDKVSVKKVNSKVEDSVSETNEPENDEAPSVERESPISKYEAFGEEEEVMKEVKEEKEMVKEEEEEKKDETPTPFPPEAESDLEAEYDNVEIGGGLAGQETTPTASDTRRHSASSGESHSSHGSDTVLTDPCIQSPMSTSPTPPSSLEPVPAPEPVHASPPAVSTTTTKSTTSTKPQPPPHGLNLNMSAAEMRAMLARKKKADPRKDTVDLKKKYEIIQNM